MAERFMALPRDRRREALLTAAAASGRPPHLLEKDVWVVWSLDVLFRSALGEHLVFKGGTSLSKAYGAIRRFSEDVDLTYDIRALAPDLVQGQAEALPESKSQEKKWSKAARTRLPKWVEQEALPVVEAALAGDGLEAAVSVDGEQLLVNYDPQSTGTGYVAPTVRLEFGARSTGEPWETRSIVSDAAEHLDILQFPTATARVMRIERTFWEKAAAVHVYCLQGRLRSERFARHWSDLERLFELGHAARAAEAREVAAQVARHKALFFSEKDAAGAAIDYGVATSGGLRLVPTGDSLAALREDYMRMVDDGLFLDDALTFDTLMQRCGELEANCNAAIARSA